MERGYYATQAGQGRYCGRPLNNPPPSFTRLTGVRTRASKAPRGGAGTRTRDMSSTAFIASRRRSNARAPVTRKGFHPLGTKYLGNITVKTGRPLSSATFTIHRRKSGAQSAKEEIIITRFIRRTAMECAAEIADVAANVIWKILIGSGQMKVKSRRVAPLRRV